MFKLSDSELEIHLAENCRTAARLTSRKGGNETVKDTCMCDSHVFIFSKSTKLTKAFCLLSPVSYNLSDQIYTDALHKWVTLTFWSLLPKCNQWNLIAGTHAGSPCLSRIQRKLRGWPLTFHNSNLWHANLTNKSLTGCLQKFSKINIPLGFTSCWVIKLEAHLTSLLTFFLVTVSYFKTHLLQTMIRHSQAVNYFQHSYLKGNHRDRKWSRPTSAYGSPCLLFPTRGTPWWIWKHCRLELTWLI